MQHLELKVKTATVNAKVNGTVVEVEREFSYQGLIKDVLDCSPAGGFTLTEMRARDRVMQAMDACNESSLSLEDADAAKLKDCVNNMRWAQRSKAFIEFSDDVLAMKPDEVPKSE